VVINAVLSTVFGFVSVKKYIPENKATLYKHRGAASELLPGNRTLSNRRTSSKLVLN